MDLISAMLMGRMESKRRTVPGIPGTPGVPWAVVEELVEVSCLGRIAAGVGACAQTSERAVPRRRMEKRILLVC